MFEENHLYFGCKGTKSHVLFLSYFLIMDKIHSSHIV